MKLIYLGCCLLALRSTAQIGGQVVNTEDGKPVPFATVRWADGGGGYTNVEGEFDFSDELLGKDLIISCVGFKTDTFKIQNSEFTKFQLSPYRIQLKSVTISDRPSKPFRLGAPKRRKGGHSWQGGFGLQHALYIPGNSLGRSILIKKIVFQANNSIAEIKAKESFFRLHLYSMGNDGFPDMDLLKANLIVYPKKNAGWQFVDIVKYFILMPPEGIFVSMEWLDNSPTSEYEVRTTEGAKETRTAIGHSLNMHKTKSHFYKHFFFYPERGWRDMSDHPYQDNENYIPCLALEVIEL